MRRHAVLRIPSVFFCAVLVALLAGPLPPVSSANVASAAPHITVYLKNYLEEYNLAVSEFLATQFDDQDSPAYGLVSYTVVTTLTPEALAGSAALIIDVSADMSLTQVDAGLIHDFVRHGGRVGLFTFPRYYWDHTGSNPAAYQAIADLFGGAQIGEPDETELESGDSSAQVAVTGCLFGLCSAQPYTLTSALVTNYDKVPFSPIASSGTVPVLTSPDDGAAVAVANANGMLVSNPIGDMVQGSDANLAYRQFVANAIVGLAYMPYKLYLPVVSR